MWNWRISTCCYSDVSLPKIYRKLFWLCLVCSLDLEKFAWHSCLFSLRLLYPSLIFLEKKNESQMWWMQLGWWNFRLTTSHCDYTLRLTHEHETETALNMPWGLCNNYQEALGLKWAFSMEILGNTTSLGLAFPSIALCILLRIIWPVKNSGLFFLHQKGKSSFSP